MSCSQCPACAASGRLFVAHQWERLAKASAAARRRTFRRVVATALGRTFRRNVPTVLGAERYRAVHIMKYKPPLVSATPRKKFGAPGYSATLLGDIRAAGITQYAYLLLVYGPSPNEPVLIVSSEFLAGGPDTVLGVFDDNGHETLYNEAGGWKDESEFAAKAVVIANERLKTDLREQMRHSDMTMFTCSTCGKKWPQNYCPECARTIDRSRTAPEPGTRGATAASAPNPEGRNRAIHSRQTLYPTKQAAVQDPIIGNATPRKCSCGGTLWLDEAQYPTRRAVYDLAKVR